MKDFGRKIDTIFCCCSRALAFIGVVKVQLLKFRCSSFGQEEGVGVCSDFMVFLVSGKYLMSSFFHLLILKTPQAFPLFKLLPLSS